MVDEALRRLERAAASDPAAALQAGVAAARAGRTDEALAHLARAWDGGQREAAGHFVDHIGGLPPVERARHAAALERLGRAGHSPALERWAEWFPSLARLTLELEPGPALVDYDTTPPSPEQRAASERARLEHGRGQLELRELLASHAPESSLRLIVGGCDAEQELVARALHALGCRGTFFADSGAAIAPGIALHDALRTHARRPFETLLIHGLSRHDATRLVDDYAIVDACDVRGIRPILGITLNPWMVPLRPTVAGPELSIPSIEPTRGIVHGPRAAVILDELLRESGLPPTSPEDQELLTRGAWDLAGLFDAVRRCFLSPTGIRLAELLARTSAFELSDPPGPADER